MRGFILRDLKPPKDVPSRMIPITIAAGATRIIDIYNEFVCLGKSVLIMNRDAVNVNTVIVNNDRINPFNVTAGLSIPINDMWIEQIEVTAGAAGATTLLIEITDAKLLGISVL